MNDLGRLSIIVTHYKSPELLKLCLEHYQKNAPRASEIIVSDSETMEETARMMKEQFSHLTYIPHEKNVGYARLVNDGLQIANGDVYLVSNGDVSVTDNTAIPKMLAYLASDPNIGVVGPRLLHMNGSHQHSCFRFYAPFTLLARRTPLGKTAWGKRELERFLLASHVNSIATSTDTSAADPFPVDWLMGSVMLVRKAAFEQAGPLDLRYFLYMEDVDWCRTFWEKGWKVMYYPQVSFYHYYGKVSKKRGPVLDLFLNKYTRIHMKSAVKYFAKYGTTVPRYGV